MITTFHYIIFRTSEHIILRIVELYSYHSSHGWVDALLLLPFLLNEHLKIQHFLWKIRANLKPFRFSFYLGAYVLFIVEVDFKNNTLHLWAWFFLKRGFEENITLSYFQIYYFGSFKQLFKPFYHAVIKLKKNSVVQTIAFFKSNEEDSNGNYVKKNNFLNY